MDANDGKQSRKKSDKAWLMLMVFSVFVFLYMMLLTVRLSSSSQYNDHLRNVHLEEFLNGNSKAKPSQESSVRISQDSRNHYVDPYFTTDIPPSDGTNLWDKDPELPYWTKAYFNWHKHKRTTWNVNNYTEERWLIMQCLADQDKRKCGGTADRLKPLPFMLRMAYNTRRILLIRWTRPAMLEDFLVPPKGGFDWRVPHEMANVVSSLDATFFLKAKAQIILFCCSQFLLCVFNRSDVQRNQWQTISTKSNHSKLCIR
jgi:hypothetical protein